MRAVILDPGGTTGYAATWVKQGELGPLQTGQIGPGDHHLELEQFLFNRRMEADREGLLIICERYENRNNDFAKLISLEYIGVVKYFYQKYPNSTTLVFQGASQAKNWCTNDKLTKWGWLLTPPTSKENRHANDALRHLGYFLCCQRILQWDAIVPIRAELLRQLRDTA